ncbi:MAG: DUF1015 family protein [Promethearchaeota archaeon]
MPELITFRNFHYKEAKEKGPERLAELVAPPYDVISEKEKEELKNKDPNNICHVILPDSYELAGKKLNQMIENGILVHGERRCLCIYGIDYKRPDTGEKISRYGFVGLLKLVDIFPPSIRQGVIPHEMTFRKYTEDRFNLIKHTDCNFSPIFMIYNGKGVAGELFKKYVNTEPFLQTRDRDGFLHKIWEVYDEEDIKKYQEIIKSHPVIIADGHHRFQTCLWHSKNEGCKYIMALFIDFNDPGLIIYTSHRQIHRLFANSIEEIKKKVLNHFETRDIENVEEMKKIMQENREEHVFGCYFLNRYIFFKLKEHVKPEELVPNNNSKEWKNLNLPILHYILFKDLGIEKEDITFVKGVKNGLENVDKGEVKALFIVNPTTLEEVHKITELGEIMPQKSTYFYPKPLSGLIIHKHTNKIE